LLFDGETGFGWKVDGEGSVADGVATLGGTKEAASSTTTAFPDGVLRFDFKGEGEVAGHLLINGKQVEALAQSGASGGWHQAEVEIAKNAVAKFQCHPMDAKSAPEAAKPAAEGSGEATSRAHIGFRVPADHHLSLKNIVFKPYGMKSLFNGKDLTGWTPVPGHKSVFTVTPEGWLNVKNGNGDLHSADQWDDFAFQIEIISNGDHLNSGIFYRAIPGEFWSGYEAQIRNQWKGDDRTKAVDYGTGGIYNRQPSRKVVSSDREWFTMTVIAEGPHHATWVNGYQTADFTDKAKPAASARKGSKETKGSISIQGHDPTTDLSFRNIRITALPK
jgi:hypothetical protein